MLLRINRAFATRVATIAALALVLLGGATAAAQNPGDFPYVAYVIEPDTFRLLSGSI